jgi:toxin FitB
MAAAVLGERFPGKALTLPAARRRSLLSTCAEAGVSGGAVYDGLVALEAAASGKELVSLDRRAVGTYRRLGVAATLIG